MSLIIVLILAGTIVSTAIKVGILLVGIKAYRERRQFANSSGATHAGEFSSEESNSEELTSGQANLRARFSRLFTWGKATTSITEPPRVLAWVQTTLVADAELYAWLTALAATEAQALAQDVTAFCELRQLQLPQLVEPPFAGFPQLQTRLGAVVLAYCRARRAAQAFQTAGPATDDTNGRLFNTGNPSIRLA